MHKKFQDLTSVFKIINENYCNRFTSTLKMSFEVISPIINESGPYACLDRTSWPYMTSGIPGRDSYLENHVDVWTCVCIHMFRY